MHAIYSSNQLKWKIQLNLYLPRYLFFQTYLCADIQIRCAMHTNTMQVKLCSLCSKRFKCQNAINILNVWDTCIWRKRASMAVKANCGVTTCTNRTDTYTMEYNDIFFEYFGDIVRQALPWMRSQRIRWINMFLSAYLLV